MYDGPSFFLRLWPTGHRKPFTASLTATREIIASFRGTQQYRVMALAQLNRRSSLRDLVICRWAHGEKLYHLGIPNGESRTTLAKANENRDWRLDADYAKPLYGPEDSEPKLDETISALNAS
ncbi:MAG: DUF4372 domain-containing protein, partial [Aestuariivita sp.]|nr:DUF4372 domain-containing protein [Aestuariivita sp.]MCY4346668.1 DUF4372 domain-containing protein [Aestuariivita sp.]